ncbi:ribosome-associated translation inhibitor RaiA [soil metagenome]
MQVQVSGKHVDVGEALGSRISQELEEGVGKYFERGGENAEVVVSKDGYGFKVDCWVRLASGQTLVTTGNGGDAHSAFTESLDKLEKRVRRYKRRLKDHHAGPKGLSPEKTENAAREVAHSMVLRDPDSVEDDAFGDTDEANGPPPVGMVIAETQSEIRTITVGRAVLELDMTGYPVVLFRNAAHGGLSVVYRRPDGNVGWIDPERTVGLGSGAPAKLNGHASETVGSA